MGGSPLLDSLSWPSPPLNSHPLTHLDRTSPTPIPVPASDSFPLLSLSLSCCLYARRAGRGRNLRVLDVNAALLACSPSTITFVSSSDAPNLSARPPGEGSLPGVPPPASESERLAAVVPDVDVERKGPDRTRRRARHGQSEEEEERNGM